MDWITFSHYQNNQLILSSHGQSGVCVDVCGCSDTEAANFFMCSVSRRHPCTVTEVFNFCWVLFVHAKGEHSLFLLYFIESEVTATASVVTTGPPVYLVKVQVDQLLLIMWVRVRSRCLKSSVVRDKPSEQLVLWLTDWRRVLGRCLNPSHVFIAEESGWILLIDSAVQFLLRSSVPTGPEDKSAPPVV